MGSGAEGWGERHSDGGKGGHACPSHSPRRSARTSFLRSGTGSVSSSVCQGSRERGRKGSQQRGLREAGIVNLQ